jgi:peptidoglycan/LPS O-acetylase OafA/YrhL
MSDQGDLLAVRRGASAASTGSSRPRNNFDGLRLIAALLVVYGHQTTDHTGNSGLRLVTFFSISGFLVAGSWTGDPQVWRFLARRVLRLWPGYAALIIGCAALSWIFPARDMPEISRMASTTYLTNLWMPGFDWGFFPGRNPVMNQSLWMLPFEIDMYLAFALVALLGRRARIAAAATLLLFALNSQQTVNAPGGVLECWSLYFSGFFAFGVLFRELPSLRGNAIVAGCVIVGVALLWSGARSAGLLLVIPPGAVWIGLRSWPVFRSAARFGDLSYGIFLWSFPIQQYTNLWLDPHLPLAAHLAVVMVQVIPIAWLSCRLIEAPALRYKPRRPVTRQEVGDREPTIWMALAAKALSLRGALRWGG